MDDNFIYLKIPRSRNVATLSSFGSRAVSKYVVPNTPAVTTNFVLQGDNGGWSTIAADEYELAVFDGYLVQRMIDDDGNATDWSAYTSYRATYTVDVSGTRTTYTNEAVTFAENDIGFSPIGNEGQVYSAFAKDLFANYLYAVGGKFIIDDIGLRVGNPPPTSATVGTGIILTDAGLYGLNANTQQFYLQASDGKAYAGAGAVTLDANGIQLAQGSGTPNKIRWMNGATSAFEMYTAASGGDTTDSNITNTGTDSTQHKGTISIESFDFGGGAARIRLFADTGTQAIRMVASQGLSLATDAYFAGSSLLHIKSTAPTFRMEDSTASAKSLLVTVDANLATFGEVTGGTFFTLDLANKDVKLDGDLLFTDATYDIGASGATRPRHLYLSGNAVIGGTITGTTTGNAPVGSAFVTIGTDATLTSERALTGTSNQITVTDNGAGSTVVLSTPQDIHTSATPQFARLGVGVAANATEKLEVAGNIYLNAGNVILKSGATRDILFEADAATEAIRIMATNSLSTAKGAAIQFYNASHASFPGQIYFDSGGAATAAIIFRTRTDTSAAPTERMRVNAAGGLTFADANNIAFGTSTGTKVGTATTQKIGFWNATPIVQPSAYTQTYSTANKTLNADGVTDPAAYGAGANGYSTGAMAAAVHAAVIALHADLLDTKQMLNSVIDDLQAIGLLS